jgi:plastocyanin
LSSFFEQKGGFDFSNSSWRKNGNQWILYTRLQRREIFMGILHRIQRSMLLGVLAVLLFSVAAVLPNAVSAHGQQAKPHTWTILAGFDSQDHAIAGMAYLPTNIWIDAGDTIVWNAFSVEPHTVTFLPPGQKPGKFDPNSPIQNFPQGGSSYDGKSFFNSGLIGISGGFPGGTSYSLTFPVTGNFTYLCFVHNTMFGHVHVRAAGTPYPFTQADYNRQAQRQGRALINDGRELLKDARAISNNHHVTVGATDGKAMVMLFIPGNIFIHVGDTVKFINRTPIDDPHTVTFGPPPTVFPPVTPYGTPGNFTGQPLNSGLLGTRTNWISPTVGNDYTVTFNIAGTFQFYCDIHPGMLINIDVRA